jgi:uncharacterized coiled-coil protein SlyX
MATRDDPRVAALEARITELEDQTALAAASLGVVLAQTLVSLDEQSEALAILRQRAKAMQKHLAGHGGQFASEVIASFLRTLYDPKLFPGHSSDPS